MNLLLPLKCPSCMGRMEVNASAERIVCGYCGNEHLIVRPIPHVKPNAPVDDEADLPIHKLQREVRSRTADLKELESQRLTSLGYAGILAGVGFISLGIVPIGIFMKASAEWIIPLFPLALTLLYLGISRIRTKTIPTAEEEYLQEVLAHLHVEMQLLTSSADR